MTRTRKGIELKNGAAPRSPHRRNISSKIYEFVDFEEREITAGGSELSRYFSTADIRKIERLVVEGDNVVYADLVSPGYGVRQVSFVRRLIRRVR
jgi:hypothetical protein